ncbi:hypothetical protein [Paracoccus seriniphilus]|uniref:hypothetical protein n=1 Tax=Paracoccus seriniphilus TaxID=184748 RepID=UPI00356B3A8E
MTVNKIMATAPIADSIRGRASGDVPSERQCLRCDAAFWSEGFGERICKRCKGLNAWRNAMPVTPGGSRRR